MQRANYDDPIYQETLAGYVVHLTLSVHGENTRRVAVVKMKDKEL